MEPKQIILLQQAVLFKLSPQPHYKMFLRQITDPALAQNAYLIGCQRTGEAIVIDPERDIDRY